jgi:hypothetical protein
MFGNAPKGVFVNVHVRVRDWLSLSREIALAADLDFANLR